MNNNDNKQLMTFENPEFGSIRSVEIDGEPWLVGKDVAAALGYSNPRDALAKHVDDEDKGASQIATPSGIQEMSIINESGLYSLIFSSQLPSAKSFKRWVTSEVLPAIRKTGSYSIDRSDIALVPNSTLEAITEQMTQMGNRIAKVENGISYANYYLRLQMRSGYDENWERRQLKNVKAVAKFIGRNEKQILTEIYREMENRYGVTLCKFCEDYKRTKKVSTCSTLSVVSFSLTLREMFDAIISEVMSICQLQPADEDDYNNMPLVEMAIQAMRDKETGV